MALTFVQHHDGAFALACIKKLTIATNALDLFLLLGHNHFPLFKRAWRFVIRTHSSRVTLAINAHRDRKVGWNLKEILRSKQRRSTMLELNESDFAEHTKEGLKLVDFYAPWCGPCRLLAPTLEQVQNVEVVKVNTDDAPDLATQFRVSGIPCLVFLKDGVEVDRLIGLHSKEAIQARVDALNGNQLSIG
jgi:thioredoxin 1